MKLLRGSWYDNRSDRASDAAYENTTVTLTCAAGFFTDRR